MEVQNAQNGENEKALEASVVENDKASCKNEEVVVEAEENDKNEVVETSAGQKSNADDKLVETFVDANGTVEEPSVLASVEASSSGIKKPQGLPTKTKIVKKVKKLVKRKIKKGTAVQVAGKENDTLIQDTDEGRTVVNIKEDEQSAEPSLGESKKEIKKVIDSVAGFPQCSSGKDKDSETSLGGNDMELEELAEAPQPTDADEEVVGGEASGKETLKEVKGKASILKRQKGKKVKGTLAEVMDKKSATILQGPKEGVEMDLIVSDKRDAGVSSEGNVTEAEKAIGSSVEASENALSVEKKQPRKRKVKAKLKKIPPAQLVISEVDKGTPQLEQNDHDNNNVLDGNKQCSDAEKLISLEANTGEGSQQKTLAIKRKQTEDKTGLAGDQRFKKKRQRKQVLGSNKKHKKEVVAAADATQERMEEKKEQLVDPGKSGMDEHSKEKIGGLIFMCNKKTRPDCFRYSVMGVQEKRKDYVIGIKPGLKLFLYDYDLKLLYGIFQASSAGGMKLERNAFGGSFPAQVRFKVLSDCIPLPESQFKKAIKENYNHKNKFKTELTHKQVYKLKKLFRPTPVPAQLTHTQPVSVLRDADRKRSDRDRYAPSSSRSRQNRTHERKRASPPPRREEQPHDLYLSEREYRTYGLRRTETTQHYPIPPPHSSYRIVNRERVRLDSYRPSVDHDWLLRQAEIDRHDRREVRLHLPEREYHMYDHLSSRREIMGRKSPDPPASAVAIDSYRRDPYYSYEYHAPERPLRTYVGSPGREDDDLYSRYVTADSLAEYYRSSRRYPSITESELPPSLVSSRYAYSGSLPYSQR